MDSLEKGDPLLEMPECDSIVVDAFISVGKGALTGDGYFPVTWQEVESYSRMSGVDLTPWESRQVINMSRVFCSTKAEATRDPNMPPPYMDDSEDYLARTRQALANKIKRAFSSKPSR